MRKNIYCLFVFLGLSSFSFSQLDNQTYVIKAQVQLDEMSEYFHSIGYDLDSVQKSAIFKINYMIIDKISSFLNENTLSQELMDQGVAERKELRTFYIKEQLSPSQSEKFMNFLLISETD